MFKIRVPQIKIITSLQSSLSVTQIFIKRLTEFQISGVHKRTGTKSQVYTQISELLTALNQELEPD